MINQNPGGRADGVLNPTQTNMMNRPLIPFIMEGQVVKTEDPDQMGRVKVWVPALDGESFDIPEIPWAEYATPFGGFTVEFPAGSSGVTNNSHAAYGLWAIPKMGATVLVFCLGGDPTRRFYFASTLRLHRNRSLPAGRNFDPKNQPGPWGDAGDGKETLIEIQPAFNNLREQFQNKMTESETITRGLYERQVAQQKFDKDGKEGYGKTPVKDEKYLDSQTYCFTTPGRYGIYFQDDPAFGRLRVKTAEGHQIILDDANERIYVSTSKGKSWVEMDVDGHVNLFGAESISVRAGEDINLFADRDINLEAGRGVNIKSDTEDVRISAAKDFHTYSAGSTFVHACQSIHVNAEQAIRISSITGIDILTSANLIATAEQRIDLKAVRHLRMQGEQIHSNGPTPATATAADCAVLAKDPKIVPGHEPWKRPATKGKRGQFWRA